MKNLIAAVLLSLPLVTSAFADTAFAVIGDYTFPNAIEGMPPKLSDFEGLQINSFTSNDGTGWVQDGSIAAPRYTLVPLAEAARVHTVLESRGVSGRVLLVP
ncbi:hypothetical protein [Cypionkella psychrotolerans]|uniref:hypothetical protein n=1 Tax=Cypionkella psychrotolerans TaxID=1678131 RepID=UPI0006B41216|nr:hypothetical protein [Cypionkella psychrotolerans]